MPEVHQSDDFREWFADLADPLGKKAILKRINRLEGGLMGDVKSVGDGVNEIRIYGPGYRLYFIRQGQDIVLLLCGGDKDNQSRDIKRAKILAEAHASEQ